MARLHNVMFVNNLLKVVKTGLFDRRYEVYAAIKTKEKVEVAQPIVV